MNNAMYEKKFVKNTPELSLSLSALTQHSTKQTICQSQACNYLTEFMMIWYARYCES